MTGNKHELVFEIALLAKVRRSKIKPFPVRKPKLHLEAWRRHHSRPLGVQYRFSIVEFWYQRHISTAWPSEFTTACSAVYTRSSGPPVAVAGRFAIICQFATWTFRTFGRFDIRTFRYLPGRFATYLKACNLWYCNNFSKSSFFTFNKRGLLSPTRNALLKSTIWQLRSIIITENLYL